MTNFHRLWPDGAATTLTAMEQDALERMLTEELKAHAAGFANIAGVDEAGRGPLAGPIVAAAVRLQGPVSGLNDSKKLPPGERVRLFEVLFTEGHDIGVATLEAAEIDALGIQTANYRVMQEAIECLTAADCVLIDGFHVPGLDLPQVKLVKGDARSLSIAAASIVAKVTRDRRMLAYETEYPGYGFARHKGYATREHLERLAALGPCPIHRRSFAPLATPHKQEVLFEANQFETK